MSRSLDDLFPPWILTLTGKCLSNYILDKTEDGFEVENDGSRLIFTIACDAPTAVILQWQNQDTNALATIMDSKCQLDAIIMFTPEALSTLHASIESSKVPKCPQKHKITLLDFKLVFTYSAPSVQFNLIINHCRIHFDDGAVKFFPSKKIKKIPFKDLEQAKKKALRADPVKSDRAITASHELSQTGGPSGIQSQQLVSQVISHDHDLLNNSSRATISHSRSDLLAILASNRSKSSRVEEQTHQIPEPKRLFSDKTDSNETSRRKEPIEEDSIAPLQPRRKDHRISIESPVLEEPGTHKLSKKRRREVMEPPPRGVTDSPTEVPSNKRQRTGFFQEQSEDQFETQAPAHRPQISSPSEAPDPVRAVASVKVDDRKVNDPWEDLARISLRDITIPKDQDDILNDNICWIPPKTGDFMPEAHVPPTLLKSWNNLVTRRLRLNKLDRAASVDRPVTPTQETVLSSSSEASWSPSPVSHLRKPNLPDSSPVVPRKSVKKIIPNPGQIEMSEDTLGSQFLSQPEGQENDQARKTAKSFATENSPSPRKISRKGRKGIYISLHTSPEHEPSDEQMEVDGQSPTQLKSQVPNPSHLLPDEPSSPSHPLQPMAIDGTDSDVESMMDVSVPLGLGEAWPFLTQNSQVEAEATSSAPPLSSAQGEQVQVAETPQAGYQKLSKDEMEPGPFNSALSSSQALDVSSQSRVLNTCPSHQKAQSSAQDSEHSKKIRGDTPLVHVPGTQVAASGSNQGSQSQSQNVSSGIVLNSSQQHENLPPSSLEPASPNFPSSQEPALPQQNPSLQPTLIKTTPVHGWTPINGASGSQTVLPPGLLASDQDQSPSKDPRLPTKALKVMKKSLSFTPKNAVSAELTQGSVDDQTKPEDSQEVYRRFCIEYANYSGSFGQFTELCTKLKAVRASGKLQRPHLWDDFIILHVENYAQYVQQCAQQETKLLGYAEYFMYNFNRPIYKKRCLTADRIDMVASIDMASQNASRSARNLPITLEDTSQDFDTTSNLMSSSMTNALYELHTRSFENNGFEHGAGLISTAVVAPTSTASSPRINTGRSSKYKDALDAQLRESDEDQMAIRNIKNKTDGDAHKTGNAFAEEGRRGEERDSRNKYEEYSEEEDGEDEENSDIEMETVEERPEDLEIGETQKEEKKDIKAGEVQDSAAASQGETDSGSDDDTSEYDESDEKEMDTDVEEVPETDTEETHREMSVELGDETSFSSRRQSHREAIHAQIGAKLDADLATESDVEYHHESESEEENWFHYLLRQRQTGPTWSDDPNTPFKKWAIADQNVLSERSRRGGYNILVDEQGVIQRPINR